MSDIGVFLSTSLFKGSVPLGVCRFQLALLRNPSGCGDGRTRDHPGIAPTPDPKREWDQDEEDDERGPLRLLETKVQGTKGHDEIGACEKDQKLGDGVAKQVGHQGACQADECAVPPRARGQSTPD